MRLNELVSGVCNTTTLVFHIHAYRAFSYIARLGVYMISCLLLATVAGKHF